LDIYLNLTKEEVALFEDLLSRMPLDKVFDYPYSSLRKKILDVLSGIGEKPCLRGVIRVDDTGVICARVGRARGSFPPKIYPDPEKAAREWCISMGAYIRPQPGMDHHANREF
jgi:hypothetical protein